MCDNELFLSFVNIMKYSRNEEYTSFENYTTELFVFLLKYLISSKNRIIYNILDEFGFDDTLKLEKLKIYTQKKLFVGKKQVIPDIILEYNKRKTIIEVKINSNLNQYKLDRKTINQLELYSEVEEVTSVYLLTKRVILIDTLKNKKLKGRVFWSKIYNLFENSNDFVIKSFNCFLEENAMKANKLDKNISTALGSLYTLSSLLEQAWNYNDYPLSSFGYSKKGWFGCYVKKNKKNILWLGLAGDELLVHFTDEKIAKKYLNDGNEYVNGSIDVIYIYDLVKIDNSDGQKEYLTKWFIEIMEKKLKKYLV